MTKVNIKALDTLHLEKFWMQDPGDNEVYLLPDADPRRVQQVFNRAGLVYNVEDQTIQFPGDPTPLPMTKVIGQVNYFKSLDGLMAGGKRGPTDGYVDETEMAIALQEGATSAEELNHLDPEAFLESIRFYMDHYYNPLAREVRIYQAERNFDPILTFLATYSEGQYISQYRQATEVLPLNGLTKSAANLILAVPAFTNSYVLGNSWINKVIPINRIKVFNEEDAPLLMADALAKNRVDLDYQHQTEVIDNFERGIALALRLDQDWAFEGDFKKALDGLTKPMQVKRKAIRDGKEVTEEVTLAPVLSAGDRKILEKTLAGAKYDKIIHNPDTLSQLDAMLSFARGENSKGWWIFRAGGGNATLEPSWFNITGTSNNYYAAKSILGSVVTKAKIYEPYDPEEQGPITEEMLEKRDVELAADGKTILRFNPALGEKYQNRARKMQIDMLGTGGSFTNVVQSVLPDIGLAAWGSEAKDGGLGRLFLGILVGIGGYRGIKWVGDAWTLRRIRAMPGMQDVPGALELMYKNGRWYNPLALGSGSLREARLAAEAREAAGVAEGTIIPRRRWFGRQWQKVKDAAYNKVLGNAEKTLAKLGYKMTPERKAQIALLAAKAPSRFATVATDVALTVGIVYKADDLRAYTNPFKKNFEFSSFFGVDLTAQDMILSAVPTEADDAAASGDAAGTAAPTSTP